MAAFPGNTCQFCQPSSTWVAGCGGQQPHVALATARSHMPLNLVGDKFGPEIVRLDACPRDLSPVSALTFLTASLEGRTLSPLRYSAKSVINDDNCCVGVNK